MLDLDHHAVHDATVTRQKALNQQNLGIRGFKNEIAVEDKPKPTNAGKRDLETKQRLSLCRSSRTLGKWDLGMKLRE